MKKAYWRLYDTIAPCPLYRNEDLNDALYFLIGAQSPVLFESEARRDEFQSIRNGWDGQAHRIEYHLYFRGAEIVGLKRVKRDKYRKWTVRNGEFVLTSTIERDYDTELPIYGIWQ